MQKIELTNGGFTVVDDDDYERLAGLTWSHNGIGYVQGWVNGKHALLHRVIMGAQKGQEIDHINRDKMDNRKDNLRFCTHYENMLNRPNSRGGLLGTTYYKDRKKWLARIRINGRPKSLGCFPTAEEAHQAYLKAAEIRDND